MQCWTRNPGATPASPAIVSTATRKKIEREATALRCATSPFHFYPAPFRQKGAGFKTEIYKLYSCFIVIYTKNMIKEFHIIIENDAGGYFARCLDMEGCFAQGETHEEAEAGIVDAIKLHLEDMGNKESIS